MVSIYICRYPVHKLLCYNHYGKINSEFHLSIISLQLLVIPIIEDFTENSTLTVIAGNEVVITCEARGYPPPTVVVSRSDAALSDRVSVSDSVSVPTEYGNVTRVSVNLTITNAFREDTGVYTCSANNTVGSYDETVNITVQCKYNATIK